VGAPLSFAVNGLRSSPSRFDTNSRVKKPADHCGRHSGGAKSRSVAAFWITAFAAGDEAKQFFNGR